MSARRVPLLIFAVCGGLTVLALLLRVPSVVQPLGIDQGLWASAALAIDQGFVLYRDVWDHKPPAIFLTYLAAGRVFGWTPAAIGWLDLAAVLATTACLFGIARRLAGRGTAVVACALFTGLTMPAAIYGYGGILERSMSETFMALLVAAGTWTALVAWSRSSVAGAGALGLAVGAAALFKPTAAIYLPAIGAWLWWRAGHNGHSRTWTQPVSACLAAGVAPALVLGWLAAQGAVGEARAAVVDFNRFYVQDGGSLGTLILGFSKAVWWRQKTDALWCAGSIAAIAALWDLVRRRTVAPLPALAVAWGAAAGIAIFANGARLFTTYFIQALPPLALLAAWWLTDGSRRSPLRRAAVAATLALMALLWIVRGDPGRVLTFAARDWAHWRGETSRATYLEPFGGYNNGRGYSARANAELATYIAAHSEPGERMFLFGMNGVDVYLASGRLPAHRFLRVNFFVPINYPDPAFQIGPVTRELTVDPPRYLVFERLHITTRLGVEVDHLESDPAVQALLRGYTRETRIEDFVLYRRLDPEGDGL